MQKIGDRIIVTKSGQTLLDIPVFQVDNIAIIGNVQITTQALHMLMLHGVDVSYFTRSGGYLGMTAAESARNIFLRFEQYRCFMEEQKRMAERAEKMDIIEKHKISSEKLQLLIKFSEDEILKLLEEKENAKEMAGNEEKVIS